VRLDPKTNTLAREGVQSIMNPYDQHAVEEAVRIKESLGGEVNGGDNGTPQAEAVLRQAISCGADHGFSFRPGLRRCGYMGNVLYPCQGNHGPWKFLILFSAASRQLMEIPLSRSGPWDAARIPFVTCVQKVRQADSTGLVLGKDDGLTGTM